MVALYQAPHRGDFVKVASDSFYEANNRRCPTNPGCVCARTIIAVSLSSHVKKRGNLNREESGRALLAALAS